MLLNKNTYTQQSVLSQYTRTGDDRLISQLQNINEKGIRYYRQLIFNIIFDTVTNAYPLLTDFFGEEKMRTLVHDFFSEHYCQTPQVWQMPKEFKDYIIECRTSLIQEHPFLPDLLHFEWMEIELFMMPDEIMPSFTRQGNIYKNKLVINPEMQILHLNYPVHVYHPGKIKKEHKNDYFVMLHRHFESKDVLFTDLSTSAVKILECLYEEHLSYFELLDCLNIQSLSDKTNLRKFLFKGIEETFILGFLD